MVDFAPEFVPDTITKKLILLFLMEKMEIPLTENSIMDICTNRKWLTYMDCKEVLIQLLKTKLIYNPQIHNNEPCYQLTYEGTSCVSLFFHKIPASIRDEISSYAKLNIQHIKRRQEYVSSYDKMADGSYMVTFAIREPHLAQTLFEIKMKMPNRSTAINSTKKWIDKAPEVYEFIFESLLNEN